LLILGKPFLKSVNASIKETQDHQDKDRQTTREVHISTQRPAYHQFQIQHVGGLPRELEQLKQPGSSQNKGQKKIVKSSRKKSDATNYSTSNFFVVHQKCQVDCAKVFSRTSELIFKVWRQSC
jgi:hypothetical protein